MTRKTSTTAADICVARASATPAPKTTTKKEQLQTLLMQPRGAKLAMLCDRLGWQKHTVRAAISRMRNSGVTIVNEPSGKTGETVYRLEKGGDAPNAPCATSETAGNTER